VVPLLQQLLVVVLVMPLVVQVEALTISVVTAAVLQGRVTVVVLVVMGNGHAQVHLQVGAAAVVVARAPWESTPTSQITTARVMVAQGWRVHFSPQVLLRH
jgi:hypothetical protein